MQQVKNKAKGKVHRPVDIARYKKQFAILKGQGILQRDIAKKLGVSENTLSAWVKELPVSQYLTIRKGMQKRLVLLTEDKDTPAIDLYNLSNALIGIEKMIMKLTTAEKSPFFPEQAG